jgi:hypothetical protein
MRATGLAMVMLSLYKQVDSDKTDFHSPALLKQENTDGQ